MRAITQKTAGGPEVLEIEDRPSPDLGHGEAVVKVKAAGINPVDIAVRGGFYPLLGEPPFTIGWDISGIVEEASEGGRFKVGDEVFGLSRFPRQAAAYAEEAAISEDEFVRKPKTLDHIHAAALPLAGLTAWQGLVGAGGLKEGQRVLVHSGAGGVGHLAVQIAKARGAYVLATASAEKIDFVRSFGADEVIDYKASDFTKEARDIDIVFETIGGDHAAQSLKSLRKGGVLVSLLDPGEKTRAEAPALGVRVERISVVPDREGLEELVRLVETGKLTVHVEKTFPLEQAGKAHEFLGTRPKGKVVLAV
ncbi:MULTISPECIES: NADP-dependent oxidoreductase [unclassified Mesorhizobium]|uniref:NADP-dependent oxidoreductase n=1 Tax=unclassified Mesorhizobium TaxID=325217 RepID=UPI0030154C61